MIWKVKAKKWDRLILLDYMLKYNIPYVKNRDEKLKIILDINNYIKDNYDKAKIIYYNFKKIGAVIIDNGVLKLFYLDNKYFNKWGLKIGKKLKVKEIEIYKNNKDLIKFYELLDFKEYKKSGNILYMRRMI